MSWQVDVYDDDSGSDSQEESFEDMIKLSPPPKRKTRKAKNSGKKCQNKETANSTAKGSQNSEKSDKKETAKRRRVVLNKAEKSNIMASISAVKTEELTVKCLAGTARQLELVSDSLKLFCESLTTSSLIFLTKHLQESFVRIYKECSTLKERYLQFQLQWHSYCSYFLITKKLSVI